MNFAISSDWAEFIEQIVFLLASCGFFICLKFLSSPKSARKGNFIGIISMVLAVGCTLVVENPPMIVPILSIMAVASVVGFFAAKKVELTAMPQMVAIFNGLGGTASVLVAYSEVWRFFSGQNLEMSAFFAVTSWFSVVVGAITFTGSIIAFLKLQGLLTSRPILVSGQRLVTILLFAVTLAAVYFIIQSPKDITIFTAVGVIAAILGVLLVIPIGGADMPVVISLLNSYSGIAALSAGFVVGSKILIIGGALVGAAGIILTRLMCLAMNRSLSNVVFGAFGGVEIGTSKADEKPMKELSPMDAAMLLNNANHVIIVPGYGLAVSQAQRNLREICDVLKDRGIKVTYGIHPVAGRMPGHMNVLLAEADVPYEELADLDEVNGEFETADVALIIGANDVVNPAARNDKNSPLYGMPILNADKSKSVIVMKRGRGRGFAGVENPLFTIDKSGVVFGDAKKSLTNVLLSINDL
jgi:NAD(P) transhydrogenase subunit beta